MAVLDSALQITQTKKGFWEAIGARFMLDQEGDIRIEFSGSLMRDEPAKSDCHRFVEEHRRVLLVLVLTQGDPAGLSRFGSVLWHRKHSGLFTEDVS